MTLKERRIARLKREIALLEGMDDQVWRKALLRSLFILPLIIAAMYFVLAKAWASSPLSAFLMFLMLVAALWWAALYSLLFPKITVYSMLSIFSVVYVVVSLLDGKLPWSEAGAGKFFPDMKEARVTKIRYAIYRRQVALAKLERTAG